MDTTIHGRQITLEGIVTDRYGNRIPHAMVTIVRNNGVPYKDEDGKPVLSLTDTKGVYKLHATVNGDYRLEIVLPTANQIERQLNQRKAF
ncbi:carboxypeptidase-like regulatory domain-containing protein [Bifidobacterium pseudocatenulatum]|uniref:carboxypeptidase-like regulatory domain-containing protein n=1 Tax=Bifidobacterium pseudocatenulatum TaxID=28026 RepID=UPI001CFD240C|nr:carboxypeptidase-like regulatory domain-containing protein [Bifidobacterium pseudocatenulatum]MCB4902650.1 carboxypeptidase-like regulatory domain-containing protein [Bifidobacterium pseudocatenulatum]